MDRNKREQASRISAKLNWADIVGNIDNLKVEMLFRLYGQHIFQGITVSATQYKETKQAYFCGFSECFRVMTDISDRYSEDQANEILSKLASETNEYIESLLDRTLK